MDAAEENGKKAETDTHKHKYTIQNATVPACLIVDATELELTQDRDSLVRVDLEVENGKIVNIKASQPQDEQVIQKNAIDVQCGMVFPTFVDMHTHIDKGHTCERSPNVDGSLGGADAACMADEEFWNFHDVRKRMEFSIRSAYAHGTSALRTHLMSGPIQGSIAWPIFAELREKWRGKVELQAVSLVVLSFFRDKDAAMRLADVVQQFGGVLGAAVSCSDAGGTDRDDWTTCGSEMPHLLDTIFRLAAERDLDVDFHVDENGNVESMGLRHIAEAAIRNKFKGNIVCGHCCSLAVQPPEVVNRTIDIVAKANITIVSLPMVNLWLQDRDHPEHPWREHHRQMPPSHCTRTPRRRGITLMHELRCARIPVAVASDNTRDQFFGFGDLDMLEVFNQSVRIGHLDKPFDSWANICTSVPADVMRLPTHGRIKIGGPADLVIFRGRCFSEVLGRPQHDRVVIRSGLQINTDLPDYRELDFDVEKKRYMHAESKRAVSDFALPFFIGCFPGEKTNGLSKIKKRDKRLSRLDQENYAQTVLISVCVMVIACTVAFTSKFARNSN